MSRPRIEAFLIDDENEEKITSHNLSVWQVMQVLDNVHIVLRNRKRRHGLYLVIGMDNGGACVAVPVEPTHQPTRPPSGDLSQLGLVRPMNTQYWISTGDSMSNERDSELKRAETWDFEKPEVREPVKHNRAVVSVAFKRDDFTQVSEFAGRIGKRTSEFIREAAIEKATGRSAWTLVYGSGSTGSQWWLDQMPATTRAFGLLQMEHPKNDPVTV